MSFPVPLGAGLVIAMALAMKSPGIPLHSALINRIEDREKASQTIDLRRVRSVVRSRYPQLDLKSVDKTRREAVMVVLLFDAADNLVGHAMQTRRSDRMLAIDAIRKQFGDSLKMSDFDHTALAALTGPREGIVPGSLWVCWGKLRSSMVR